MWDFIGVIIKKGKLIIIISPGDIAKDLEKILEKLGNPDLIKLITNNLSSKIDFFIVTGRSQMRKNSTIEMLHNRIPFNQRKEFWTLKSDDIKDRNKIKENIVNEIIDFIENK